MYVLKLSNFPDHELVLDRWLPQILLQILGVAMGSIAIYIQKESSLAGKQGRMTNQLMGEMQAAYSDMLWGGRVAHTSPIEDENGAVGPLQIQFMWSFPVHR